jgi:hypothetical protein
MLNFYVDSPLIYLYQAFYHENYYILIKQKARYTMWYTLLFVFIRKFHIRF